MAINDFISRYRELETRMKQFAEKDGGIYLPNIEPRGPVNYFFICMEPSLGHWAKNREKARAKVAAGFRNFIDGYTVMILHYCIRRFLCKGNQTYHITDLSKEAMLTKDAKPSRTKSYAKWYSLLAEEVSLVASANATIFAVGKQVTVALQDNDFQRKTVPVIHYSGIAAVHWRKVCEENQQAFSKFKNTVAEQDFRLVAEEAVRDSGMPEKMCQDALGKLCSRPLTISSKQLMFNYYHSFQVVDSV